MPRWYLNVTCSVGHVREVLRQGKSGVIWVRKMMVKLNLHSEGTPKAMRLQECQRLVYERWQHK